MKYFANGIRACVALKWLSVVALTSLLVTGCASGEEAQSESTEENGSGNAVQPSEKASRDRWPVEEVAAELGPLVVQVNVEAVRTTPFGPREGSGMGSGVIYSEDGYIITNNHVVQNSSEVNVAFADGSVEEGEVVGTDPFTEIAVVKVSREGLPAANFVEDLDPVVGELVVAIGSPSGFQSTVTLGLISGLNREVPAQLTGGRQEAALVDLIQTDAAISPGSSGGALANAEAEVIGITVAGLPPAQTGAANIGFAIPSETAISVADQIIESGEASHPYLGVSLTNLNPRVSERFGIPVETGALVTRVDSNGPADEAGIGRETVIIAVASERIETTGDLLAALREYRPGDRVNLTVVEDGNEREVAVELGERS